MEERRFWPLSWGSWAGAAEPRRETEILEILPPLADPSPMLDMAMEEIIPLWLVVVLVVLLLLVLLLLLAVRVVLCRARRRLLSR